MSEIFASTSNSYLLSVYLLNLQRFSSDNTINNPVSNLNKLLYSIRNTFQKKSSEIKLNNAKKPKTKTCSYQDIKTKNIFSENQCIRPWIRAFGHPFSGITVEICPSIIVEKLIGYDRLVIIKVELSKRLSKVLHNVFIAYKSTRDGTFLVTELGLL